MGSYSASILHVALVTLTSEGKGIKHIGFLRVYKNGEMKKDMNSQDTCCPTYQLGQLKQLILLRQSPESIASIGMIQAASTMCDD